MIDAYIGLGANLGDAIGSVRSALVALRQFPQTQLVAASGLYRTPAWGREQQPDFVNAAACLRTRLPAEALLAHLLEVERRFGRVREPGGRWGPRTLDLDLLLYGEQIIDVPGLQVPHPFLHERAFALVPLLEIAPQLQIPRRGSVHAALAALDAGAILPIGG